MNNLVPDEDINLENFDEITCEMQKLIYQIRRVVLKNPEKLISLRMMLETEAINTQHVIDFMIWDGELK